MHEIGMNIPIHHIRKIIRGSTIMNMAKLRTFEDISDKYNTDTTSSSQKEQ
jgi:hypothetical protein